MKPKIAIYKAIKYYKFQLQDARDERLGDWAKELQETIDALELAIKIIDTVIDLRGAMEAAND